ncbi:hydantoin utilization protein A [Desulforamulus profundi]|uniref:Hydantoin utilization protein A n=1 Tax=Desulforamulus profundi TaxID=1383067 RepID=A0A2C6L216_9FIRM|nr:hydrogenase nickel incorporation protein HypB [Desulforamulus profundi]PHJ37681.1 hydantoin utilization protein A [Desulforamulus profundi]
MQVKVVTNVLRANEDMASKNRTLFNNKGLRVINLISSPGAGKTTLLETTIRNLKDKVALGVIEGDLMTARDAERIARLEVPVVQINTRGGCHLDANMVNKAWNEFPPETPLELLVIENVGNLVCPAAFDLGEDEKVVIISVTEGSDKPAKYPTTFERASLCLLNKIDLLAHTNFNLQEFYQDLQKIKPHLPVIEVSALTGQGMESWYDWLVKRNGTAS